MSMQSSCSHGGGLYCCELCRAIACFDYIGREFCAIHHCGLMLLADGSAACRECMLLESPAEQMERMQRVYRNCSLFDCIVDDKPSKKSLLQKIKGLFK